MPFLRKETVVRGTVGVDWSCQGVMTGKGTVVRETVWEGWSCQGVMTGTGTVVREIGGWTGLGEV